MIGRGAIAKRIVPAAARAVIRGSKTGIGGVVDPVQVYPPEGWTIAAHSGVISEAKPKGVLAGVWNVNDNWGCSSSVEDPGAEEHLEETTRVSIEPQA